MKLGFQFVPFPREIWEKSIDLSKAEFRLLGWFLAGLRLGVAQGKFTDDQILSGMKDMPPLGLARNSMKDARAALQVRGLLVSQQIDRFTWSYSLPVSEIDTKSKIQVSETDTLSIKVGHSECQSPTEQVSEVDRYKRKKISTEEPERAEFSAPPDLHPNQYAMKIIQELVMTENRQHVDAVSGAFNLELNQGKSRPAAYEFILAISKDAKDAGVIVDFFYFRDWGKNRNGVHVKPLNAMDAFKRKHLEAKA